MAWPEGDVFPEGWSTASAMGSKWYVDYDFSHSADASLAAVSSGMDMARLRSPTLTLASSADATFWLRLDGNASGAFTVDWVPPDDDASTLLYIAPIGSMEWAEQTVSIPAGTGYLLFRIVGYSGTEVQAWIDDVVLPESSAPTVASVPWPVTIAPLQAHAFWPIIIFDGARVVWPVAVVSATPDVASVPWRVQVVHESSASLGWPVSVLDAAVVGGLDGAGGWSAAPDGRWQPVVTLDGADIAARLTGAVSMQHADNAARTAQFAYLPASAVQPMSLIGRPVQIAFAQSGGVSAQTLFTGVIETPEIDVQTGVITCTCTDQAQDVWAAMSRPAIDALVGGRWHAALGEPADNHEYMRARLESVPASWALDALRRPAIVLWDAAARSVTVRTADVVDGSLSVSLPSRSELRSRVTCTLQYRFPRLRIRGASARYAQSRAFFVRGTLEGVEAKQWLTRDMIMGALEGAQSSGWTLAAPVEIEHPRPQTIEPTSSIGGLGGGYTITAKDAQSWALGFKALLRARWAQSITETRAVTVVWPQIEAQLGTPAAETIGATLESEFDSGKWEADETVAPTTFATFVGDLHEDYESDGATAADADAVMLALLDRAWVRLYGASRSGRVRFSLPCRPDLWLDTHVSVETPTLRAAGKIVEVEHVLDPTSGDAITQLAIAVGMPGATPAAQPLWSLPARPADPYSPPLSAYGCQIGTYVGGEIDSPVFNEATMIGFCTNIEDLGLTDAQRNSRNWYPLQLSIKSPDIAAESRDPREVASDTTIEVAVPTSLLEIL